MGCRAHIVKFESAKLEGSSDFFDLLERHFKNDEGEVYIEQHIWDDLLKDRPSIRTQFPNEIKEVQEDLTAEGGCLTYAFF